MSDLVNCLQPVVSFRCTWHGHPGLRHQRAPLPHRHCPAPVLGMMRTWQEEGTLHALATERLWPQHGGLPSRSLTPASGSP